MSALEYHLKVGAGNALLRVERMRSEQKLKKPWQDELFGPPLSCSPRLKELMSRHYLKGRYANLGRKVAWVTSGAPVEHLSALGFFLLYPENHAALCGARRATEGLATFAEEQGYSREICSYARTDLGTVLSGNTPVGRLPKPDLLVCCNNICQTVLYWYQVLAEQFKVPLIVIDAPFVYTEPLEHQVAFVKRQLEESIGVAERIAGRTLAPAALEGTFQRAREAMQLWSAILERGTRSPAPITAFDEFIHMAPVVEMRGEQFTVDYYRTLLAELDERVSRGVGAVKNERKRLVWDNLPIWARLRWLSKLLAKRGVAIVASTYTNAWGELESLLDPSKPIESAARAYLQPILNRGTGHKLRTMEKMVSKYRADGVILHSDRSCKPYSVGQIDQRDRLTNELGVPALLLEADHADPRAFSEEQTATRLDAFLEVIGA